MTTNRSLLPVLALGGVLCALLLSACGGNASPASSAAASGSTSAAVSTSSAASSATPAAPSTVNTAFTSADGAYSLKYPDGWTSQAVGKDSSTAMMFLSTDAKSFLVADPQSTQVDASTYPELGRAFLQGLNATDVQMGTTTQSVTFASGTWQGVQGTATFNSVPSTITELGQDHNGKTFLIFTIAPTDASDSIGSTYFQPMLDSLSFAS